MNVVRFLLHGHRLLRVLVAVVLGLLLITLPSAQALTFGSAVRITTNTGHSQSPSVAAVGGYVYVAWGDDTPIGGGYDEIWLRVSSNNGASFGSAIRLTFNMGYSASPSVAAVGNHVYVAWMDDTRVYGSGVAYEIWMRVSSNYGASFGSAIRITTNPGFSDDPSVAAVGNHVYVAWDDNTPVTGSTSGTCSLLPNQPPCPAEIWMRISSNYGVSFGSPIRITTNTRDSESPSVAALGSYVYVAWMDNTLVPGSGVEPEIWMRVSSNYGASFGSPVRITTNYGTSADPSVAAVGNNVYVAWHDDTPVTGSGGSWEIWMRVSSNSGASFGSAKRISTNTGYSVWPSVAAVGSYVYVAWEDGTPVPGSGDLGNDEIWMRVSSNNGASLDSAIRISTNTGYSVWPSVAAVGSNVYVAWQDDTPVTGSGTAPEIWLRVGS